MKKFIVLSFVFFLSVGCFKSFANTGADAVAKPQKAASMVTILGQVIHGSVPEEVQQPQNTVVVFYPYDRTTLQPGPIEAIKSIVPLPYKWHHDDAGRFSISLSDEYLYKAKVASFIYEARYEGFGYDAYRSKFFPNTFDINEAELIDPAGPFVYISVVVGFIPILEDDYDTTTAISGVVYDENNVPTFAHVTAYRINTDSNGIETLEAFTGKDTINSDYSMRFIPQGEYILRIQPLDTLHEEGYYSETEGIVSAWQDATRIPVSTLDQIEKNIVLKPRSKAASGESTISGMISGRKPETGNFISMKGVRVYLRDESSQIKYSTYTNNNGNFSISNIAEGKYQIFADKPGYSMRVYNFEAKPEGNELVLDGIMNAGSITSVDKAEETDKIEGQIYPNPSQSDYTIIQFPAQGKPSSLLITNTLGQLVFTTNIETTDGINTFPLNVSKFPSGVYSVIISTGAETIRLPQLQVVR